MNNKIIKYLFGIILISSLLIIGCGSGGQSVVPQETPDAAVMRIADSWKVSNSSPQVFVDNSNSFVRQARAEDEQSGNSYKTITLYDLAGKEKYELTVLNHKTTGNEAFVECSFFYGSDGYLNIFFQLVFEESKWWLDNVIITNKELAADESIYYVEHIKLDANGKEIPGGTETETLKGKVDTTATAVSKEYENFEYLKDKSSETSSGTISKEKILVLKLYYQYNKKASYTIKYVEYGSNPEIVLKTDTTHSDVIGKLLTITDILESTDIDDYEFLEDKSKIRLEIEESGTTFILYYKKIDYVITGTITSGDIIIVGAKVKAFYENDPNTAIGEAETDESGNYSIPVSKPGFYLVVVSAEGYEPQTMKVEVEKSNKNTKANCKL